MSIPGKVLIAVLSALAVSFIANKVSAQQSFAVLFSASAIAALLAVLLSHRALPMPSSLHASANLDSDAPPVGNKPRRESKPKSKPLKKPSAATQATGDSEVGTVKWFNGTKGFGFIIRENGEEIFVHHRSIQGEGRRSLSDGAKVKYRVATTDKGPQAEDVEALD
jgi:cold shock CspA family protein